MTAVVLAHVSDLHFGAHVAAAAAALVADVAAMDPVSRLLTPYTRYRAWIEPVLDPVVEAVGARALGLKFLVRALADARVDLVPAGPGA